MTSDDIESLQIIATTNDGKHIMTVTHKRELIKHVVSSCQFAKLKEDLLEHCALIDVIEE